MRAVLMSVCIAAFCGVSALPQSLAWRQSLMNLPASPPDSTSIEDLERFEQNLYLAMPYFAGLGPGEYAANREMIRRMVTYVAGVERFARSPGMSFAVDRAYRMIAALRWAELAGSPPPDPVPGALPARPAAPPFALEAPAVKDASKADLPRLTDLQTRYEFASARAASAWQAAENLKQRLRDQSLSLNAATDTSLARLQLYLELAAGAMQSREWNEAQTNIERAEYETEKVFNVVGR